MAVRKRRAGRLPERRADEEADAGRRSRGGKRENGGGGNLLFANISHRCDASEVKSIKSCSPFGKSAAREETGVTLC